MALIIKDNIIGGKVFDKNMVFGCDEDVERLVIPNHVEGIGEQAFAYNPYENKNSKLNVLKFEPGGHIVIGPSAFSHSFVEKIDFSNSVVEILDDAFGWCGNLREVIFGDNLIKIGNMAFHDDNKIEVLKLPEGLQVIETQAFQGCKSLKRLTIPDTVSDIGNGAFNQCDKLEEINASTGAFDLFFESFNPKNKLKMAIKYLSGGFKCAPEIGEKMIAFIQKNQKKVIEAAFVDDNDFVVGALLALPIKVDRKYVDAILDKSPVKIKGLLLNYKKNE